MEEGRPRVSTTTTVVRYSVLTTVLIKSPRELGMGGQLGGVNERYSLTVVSRRWEHDTNPIVSVIPERELILEYEQRTTCVVVRNARSRRMKFRVRLGNNYCATRKSSVGVCVHRPAVVLSVNRGAYKKDGRSS